MPTTVPTITLTHSQLRDERATNLVSTGWALCLEKLAALFEAAGFNAVEEGA